MVTMRLDEFGWAAMSSNECDISDVSGCVSWQFNEPDTKYA